VSQREFLSESNNHQLPTIEQPKIVMLDEDTSMDTIDIEIENRQSLHEENVLETQDRQKEKGKKPSCHFKIPKSKKEAVSEAKKLMMTLDKETGNNVFAVFKAVARFGKLGVTINSLKVGVFQSIINHYHLLNMYPFKAYQRRLLLHRSLANSHKNNLRPTYRRILIKFRTLISINLLISWGIIPLY